MSPQIWRRSAAAALVAAALASSLGVAAPAFAQPTDSTQPSPQPTMTADQALAIVQRDYDLGAGGGQLSNLIHQVLALRAKGVKASPANRNAIVAALDKRPNQAPLIAALQETLIYQRKQIARASVQAPAQGAPPVAPPVSPNGAMGPAPWAPGNPMIQDPNDTIFPMPGR